MSSDKSLKLLNKLAKIIRAKEILDKAKDLGAFEELILDRLDVSHDILYDVAEALDELWELHRVDCPDRGIHSVEVQEQEELSTERVVKTTSVPFNKSTKIVEKQIDLSAGVGMVAGGMFEYLRSPENVGSVEGPKAIQQVSEEELAFLESEGICDSDEDTEEVVEVEVEDFAFQEEQVEEVFEQDTELFDFGF